MPVVRGDRIGESQKLNRCSVQAQDFYALFVSAVPDDFGRYRHSAAHVALALYPRREPTPGLLRRVGRLLTELEREGLVRTWTLDDVVFGEVTGFTSCGNLYHRTPEPPWSNHTHTWRCGTTALARLREWGTRQDVADFALWLKELRQQSPNRARTDRDTGGGTEPERGGEPPSPPSPPSFNTPPLPPSRSRGGNGSALLGGNGASDSSAPGDGRQGLTGLVESAVRQLAEAGAPPGRGELRALRAAFRSGKSLTEVQEQIGAGWYRRQIPL